eukprot:COSAG01_NODE_647_length_14531_cov_61.773489_3_plen_68_part_00
MTRRPSGAVCPSPTAECVICKEETVTDIEGKSVDMNVYPAKTHPDGNNYECKGFSKRPATYDRRVHP